MLEDPENLSFKGKKANLRSVLFAKLRCTVSVHILKHALQQFDKQGEIGPGLGKNGHNFSISGPCGYTCDPWQDVLLQKLAIYVDTVIVE